MQQRAEICRGLTRYKFVHLNRANSQSSSTQESKKTYLQMTSVLSVMPGVPHSFAPSGSHGRHVVRQVSFSSANSSRVSSSRAASSQPDITPITHTMLLWIERDQIERGFTSSRAASLQPDSTPITHTMLLWGERGGSDRQRVHLLKFCVLTARQHTNDTTLPTRALKLRGDISRSRKQGISSPTNGHGSNNNF